MFIVTKSLKKKINHCHVNVIHMHKIAFEFILLQLLVVCVCLVPLFVTIAIPSYAFLVTVFCPVCIKTSSIYLTRNQFV
jgi:hypothetical protein